MNLETLEEEKEIFICIYYSKYINSILYLKKNLKKLILLLMMRKHYSKILNIVRLLNSSEILK
jgi:hypothetical protein